MLLLGSVEGAVLLSAFIWQLFFGHDGWADFNSSDVLVFHVLSLCLTLWKGPHVDRRQPTHQQVSLVVFRSSVCAIDALVLARMARVRPSDAGAGSVARLALVCVLTAASLYRWAALITSLKWIHALSPHSVEDERLRLVSEGDHSAGDVCRSMWT